MAFERPHLKCPFQLDPSGSVIEMVEQDTPEHVMSCEQVIVQCPVGFRNDRPEFGWPWPEMRNMPIDTDALKRALEEFEPRGKADVTEWFDTAVAAVQHLSVNVTVESQDKETDPTEALLDVVPEGYVYR